MFSCDYSAQQSIGRTENLAERVLKGGYPEALKRGVDLRRGAWFRAYVLTLMNRDMSDIARVNKAKLLTRLVDIAALSSGQLLNLSKIRG